MKIFNSIADIENMEPISVAVGNFDGVHYGHQELIKIAVEKAHELNIKAAVFTFSNHPRELLPNSKPVKNILYSSEKEEIIESLGVDYMFNVPFTNDIMMMSEVDFAAELIGDKLNVKAIVCGFNYKFGYKAGGNHTTLKKMGREKGYETIVVEPFKIEGNVVSSSLIRECIALGDVEKCSKYMGRNYDIKGEVIVGNKLGRKFGFPTSNLKIDEDMVSPKNGVYITYCDFEGKRYASITNVGVKPTIGNYSKNVETHIFDFNSEIYGRQIKIEFIKKIRDEVKFENFNKLIEQVKRDCDIARSYHDKHNDELAQTNQIQHPSYI